MNNKSTIKVAVVGYGMSAQTFHIPLLFSSDKYEIKAFLERTKSESTTLFPEAKLYRQLNELLTDDEVELVVLTSPNVVHYQQAISCLQAGKYVVVEKPLCLTKKQAIHIKTEAEKTGKTVCTFQNRRWDSDFLWLQKLIASDTRIYEIESRFDRYRDYIKGWKEQAGNGLLYDIGSHLIDQIFYLFPNAVRIYADVKKQRACAEEIDYFELHYKAGDIKIILKASMTVVVSNRLTVHTNLGSFIKPSLDQQETLLKEKSIKYFPSCLKTEYLELINLEKQTTRIELPLGEYDQFYEKLFNHIRFNQPVPVEIEDTIRVIAEIESIMNLTNE